MFGFFVVIHVLICVALILVVLLQAGRGGGLAGAFGGGGAAQTFFGGRGAATFLSKATAWLAVAFMVLSILLAILSNRAGGTAEGLLQRQARQRASQVNLPPSTNALDPATALDAFDSLGIDKLPGLEEAPAAEGQGSEGQESEGETGNDKP